MLHQMIKRLNHKHIEEGRFYSVSEVSYVTGYCPNTIRKHIHGGKLRAFGPGRKILLDGGEVLDFLKYHVNG